MVQGGSSLSSRGTITNSESQNSKVTQSLNTNASQACLKPQNLSQRGPPVDQKADTTIKIILQTGISWLRKVVSSSNVTWILNITTVLPVQSPSDFNTFNSKIQN